MSAGPLHFWFSDILAGLLPPSGVCTAPSSPSFPCAAHRMKDEAWRNSDGFCGFTVRSRSPLLCLPFSSVFLAQNECSCPVSHGSPTLRCVLRCLSVSLGAELRALHFPSLAFVSSARSPSFQLLLPSPNFRDYRAASHCHPSSVYAPPGIQRLCLTLCNYARHRYSSFAYSCRYSARAPT
jgi:hypothetical protein